MKPIVLPPNVLRHFYAGGARIAEFRRLDLDDDHMPEEWLGAVNTVFGDSERGLSRLPDGTLLRDAVAADSEGFLGPYHVARFGTDTALLVKLLDAGQRLPVHFHPGREFAREHLHSDHGKTEAWLIFEAEPGASVHVGFAEPVGPDAVRDWMLEQDSAAMLAAMRELPVRAGDVVHVPAGTPHAIGAGILMVEIQEPTDFSILLEWDGFELDEDGAHLDLGWDVALRALDRSGWDEARVGELRGPRDGRAMLPLAAEPYFRAERLRGGDELDPGYSVLVVTEGEGALVGRANGEQPLRRGDALLLPHAAGERRLDGDVGAIRCRPPAAR